MAPYEYGNTVDNVAYFSFVVDTIPGLQGVDPDEDRLFYFAREIQEKLEDEISSLVRRTMGEEFRVEDFTIEQGSAIITFSLAALAFFNSPLGQTLLDFSRYEAFVKSINLLKTQITSLIGKAFSGYNGPLRVNSSWQPSMKMNAAILSAKTPPRSSAHEARLQQWISHAGYALHCVDRGSYAPGGDTGTGLEIAQLSQLA
jgi:hypothetical protein